MSDSLTFPGDKIASIEEYEAGKNAFDDGDVVRSATTGTVQIDKKMRLVNVNHGKSPVFPQLSDIVIGVVTAVLSSMIAVAIQYINGKKTNSGIECVCSTRNIRKKTIALVNDVIALRIISFRNGAIHATINEPELGVLFSRCVKCGKDVISLKTSVKCVECSWVDERKLSTNFGNSDFLKLDER